MARSHRPTQQDEATLPGDTVQIHLPVLPLLVLSKALPARDHRSHCTKDETEPQPLRTCSRSSGCWLVAQGFELRQSDSISYLKLSPATTQGTQKSWEASEDLAALPQLRGGALGWKPRAGSALCVRVWGGPGGSPLRPSPPPARPALIQTQEAQRPWPDSWTGGGELSGENQRREKLLGNSGWPPETRRLSQLRAPELGPPSPSFLSTWAKLEGVRG